MEIRFKKLPPHWRYLVSRRQIREAVADQSDRIRVIDFSGPQHRPYKHYGAYWAAQCDARFVDADWCFRLQFCGVPEEVLRLAAEDLAPKVIAGVCEFLAEHTGTENTIPNRGKRRVLRLQSENGAILSSDKTEPLDGFQEKLDLRRPWW